MESPAIFIPMGVLSERRIHRYAGAAERFHGNLRVEMLSEVVELKLEMSEIILKNQASIRQFYVINRSCSLKSEVYPDNFSFSNAVIHLIS
jgi:hypothetical protein